MSVAYFIVLDTDDVDFDTFVNGKHVAAVFDDLSAFCQQHSLNTIDDFTSQDVSDFLDEFEFDELASPPVQWFAAAHGIAWLEQLLQTLKSEAPNFASKAVIDDLDEYLSVLKQANQVGASWHFELDF